MRVNTSIQNIDELLENFTASTAVSNCMELEINSNLKWCQIYANYDQFVIRSSSVIVYSSAMEKYFEIEPIHPINVESVLNNRLNQEYGTIKDREMYFDEFSRLIVEFRDKLQDGNPIIAVQSAWNKVYAMLRINSTAFITREI